MKSIYNCGNCKVMVTKDEGSSRENKMNQMQLTLAFNTVFEVQLNRLTTDLPSVQLCESCGSELLTIYKHYINFMTLTKFNSRVNHILHKSGVWKFGSVSGSSPGLLHVKGEVEIEISHEDAEAGPDVQDLNAITVDPSAMEGQSGPEASLISGANTVENPNPNTLTKQPDPEASLTTGTNTVEDPNPNTAAEQTDPKLSLTNGNPAEDLNSLDHKIGPNPDTHASLTSGNTSAIEDSSTVKEQSGVEASFTNCRDTKDRIALEEQTVPEVNSTNSSNVENTPKHKRTTAKKRKQTREAGNTKSGEESSSCTRKKYTISNGAPTPVPAQVPMNSATEDDLASSQDEGGPPLICNKCEFFSGSPRGLRVHLRTAHALTKIKRTSQEKQSSQFSEEMNTLICLDKSINRGDDDICAPEAAWYIFWKETNESPEKSQLFVDAGSIPLFLKCFTLLPHKFVLLQYMMGLLGNISEVSTIRHRLMNRPLVCLLVRLLEDTSHFEIHYNAARTLANLLADVDMSNSFKKISSPHRETIVEKLLAAEQNWKVSAERNPENLHKSLQPFLRLIRAKILACQIFGVWTLANLTGTQPERYCSLLVAENGQKPLLSLISEFGIDSRIGGLASVALENVKVELAIERSRGRGRPKKVNSKKK